MVEPIAFDYSVGSSNLPGSIGLSAIGKVTHLLNVWMINPCEFESHLVRYIPISLLYLFTFNLFTLSLYLFDPFRS